MKQSQLDRIIKLVRRTGDRFVIMDKETEEVMVLMNLGEYENLLNDVTPVACLPEEDMLQKINHDIARWREQNLKNIEPDWEESETEDEEPTEAEVDEMAEEPHLEPIIAKETPIAPLESQESQENANLSEETLADLPEGEEEKFYLEPIE